MTILLTKNDGPAFIEVSKKLGLYPASSQPSRFNTGGQDPTKSKRIDLVIDPDLDESGSSIFMCTCYCNNCFQNCGSSTLEKVRRTAQCLAHDVLNFTGKNDTVLTPSKCHEILRSAVREMSDERDQDLLFLQLKLDLYRQSYEENITILADKIFADGRTTWERIVLVYTLAARLAQYAITDDGGPVSEHLSAGRPNSHSERIAQFVGDYVTRKLGNWIIDNGGWEAFENHFTNQGDLKKERWKNGLLFTGLSLGLGVLGTYAGTRLGLGSLVSSIFSSITITGTVKVNIKGVTVCIDLP